MFGLGISEFLILLLVSFGGMGLPLGVPPAEEDPMLAKVAPDECTFYLSWAGMAEPDAESGNPTEQLLAEPEMQRLFQNLDRALTAVLSNASSPNEMDQLIAETAPPIVKAILSKPGAVFVGKVSLGVEGIQVDGGLVVNTGEDTDKLKESVARLESGLEGMVKTVDVDGQAWKEFPMPEGFPRMLWGFRGNYMILGVGENSIENTLRRVRTEPPEWLTELRGRLAVPRTSTVSYVNVPALIALSSAMRPEPGMKTVLGVLGLDNVQYVGSVSGLDETGYVNRMMVAVDGDPDGLLSLVSGEPLSVEDLKPIPKDATFALAARLDSNRIFRQFLESVAKVDLEAKKDIDRELSEFENETGLKISEDVLQPLGDCWRIYNSPGDGGLLFTGLTGVVSVRDRDQIVKTLEKIEQITLDNVPSADSSGRRLPRHTVVRHFEYEGQTIYFLNSVGDWSPFAPAWCVTDNELIISLFPSHVKCYISRGADFLSITEVPEVAERLGAGPVLLGYQDSRELFKLWYPVVQIVSQYLCSGAQQQGVDFNMSMIPSAAAIAPHLHPATATLTHSDGAIELTIHQSVPMSAGPLPMLMPMTFGVFPLFIAEPHRAETSPVTVAEFIDGG